MTLTVGGILVVATNENDVLDEFFNTGHYAPRSSDDTFQTSSPSMDISKASNFERFIFDLFGRDSSTLNDHWKKIDGGKSFKLKEDSFPLDISFNLKIFLFNSSSPTITTKSIPL